MTCPSSGLGLSHHAENLLPPSRPDLEALLFQRERALDCQLLTDSGLPANGWLQMGKIIFHINTTLQGEKACCSQAEFATSLGGREAGQTERGR